MTEEQLVKKAKDGDMEAFEELIRIYEKQIYNVAYRIVGSYDDALDVSQEAMVKIFKNLAYFEEKSKLSTWIYRIVTNTALDFLKKYGKHKVVSIDQKMEGDDNAFDRDFPSTDASPQENMEQKERREAILHALDQLSPEHKAVLVLRDFSGLSYEEIARATLCSEGTVKSRINRARKSLRKILLRNRELFDDYLV